MAHRGYAPLLLRLALAMSIGDALTVKYQYDEKSKIVYVHPGDCISLSSIEEYFSELLSDEGVRPEFVEVVYFDEVRDFNFSSDEALSVQRLIANFVNQKQYKGVVFIANNNLQYGMARMFGSILDEHLPVTIVRSEDESKTEIIKLHG